MAIERVDDIPLAAGVENEVAAASAVGGSRTLRYGAAFSLTLHLLIVALLLWNPLHRGGTRAAKLGAKHPVIITLERPQAATPQVAPAPVKVPDKPPDPKPRPDDTARPPPRPAKPKAAQPSKANAQATPASDAGEKKARVETDPEAEADNLLQGIRDRWLQPPHTSREFHCRIRIDYQLGGMISSVKVQEGCGAISLDDSVERAVWKMQPLPLAAARTQAGSMIVDFSP